MVPIMIFIIFLFKIYNILRKERPIKIIRRQYGESININPLKWILTEIKVNIFYKLFSRISLKEL